VARKKTSKTDQTETQDAAAEDAPAPETETSPTEKPSSDAPKATSVTETPEQSADHEATAQDTTTDQPEPASEPESTTSTTEADGTQEDTSQEPEPGDETTPRPEDEDPMAEVATMAEAEEAQAAQQTDEAETPAPAAPVTKTEQVTIRQGGFWSMLLGGVVAAGIGVIAAPYVLPDHPLRPAEDSVDTVALQDRIAAQETAMDDLQSTVESIPTAPDLSGELGDLRNTLTDLAEQVSTLESRLAELEDRPAPEAGGSDVSASQIEELSAALSAQRAEIDALKGEAEAEEAAARDSARATLQRAALTRVMTALDTGDDFSPALSDLRETGVDVPAALADAAENGVPTQEALIESFPDAARAALAAERSADGGAASSVGGFFKNQLGIRSLEPREGDDPDAVLSRAEAAVRDGRLGDALAEIETLPEGARAALSDWAADAERRSAALSAANALAGTMN
jgi:hypothetical protein